MIMILTIIGIIAAVGFFVSSIRALLFALKYQDQFSQASVIEKSGWWLRLFQKNGFGSKVEAKRKSLSVQLIGFGIAFFVVGGIVQLLLPM